MTNGLSKKDNRQNETSLTPHLLHGYYLISLLPLSAKLLNHFTHFYFLSSHSFLKPHSAFRLHYCTKLLLSKSSMSFILPSSMIRLSPPMARQSHLQHWSLSYLIHLLHVSLGWNSLSSFSSTSLAVLCFAVSSFSTWPLNREALQGPVLRLVQSVPAPQVISPCISKEHVVRK